LESEVRKYRAKGKIDDFRPVNDKNPVVGRWGYEFLENLTSGSSWDGITVKRDELPLLRDE
jgi:hypothetical protein